MSAKAGTTSAVQTRATPTSRPAAGTFFSEKRRDRAALKEEEEGKAAALAAATAAEEKTEKAEAFALRQAESAKENATAAGQWLVSLGLEREELKGQLAAAQTNRCGAGGGEGGRFM